jgi:hypothetical protein
MRSCRRAGSSMTFRWTTTHACAAGEHGAVACLVHPSDPDLYKIGVTILQPEKRLAQHNSQLDKYTGRIVKETGQKWELKTFIPVPDPYWAESVFWGATVYSVMPFRGGIEVERMKWEEVQAGLEAAKNAGMRPPPKPLYDYVYAYSAEMKERLLGRDIELVGYVTSRSGKSTFRCINGHEWRTWSRLVGKGEGCPQCGIGQRAPEEIQRAIKEGFLCLLIHPDRPGFIRIGVSTPNQWQENLWGDWVVHRSRTVSDPVLAESLIWRLLGHARPDDGEPIQMDLSEAEQAIRDLLGRMQSEIAVREKWKEQG